MQGLQKDLTQIFPGLESDATAALEPLQELKKAYQKCLSEGALAASKCLGLPFSVGDSIASAVNRLSAPRLRVALDALLLRAGVELAREDPLAQRLMSAVIRAASRSIGIAASCFAEARLGALPGTP
ncbi:unnamed protein product, partial [Effrenium voratum]